MTDIKVRLSLEVPGATMLSSQDCEKMSKDEAYETNLIQIEHQKKKGVKKLTKKENLIVFTRKSKPAKQNISISREAYKYMTDKKCVPSFTTAFIWNKLNAKKRLERHLQEIAEYFNALSYSYEILDD